MLNLHILNEAPHHLCSQMIISVNSSLTVGDSIYITETQKHFTTDDDQWLFLT